MKKKALTTAVLNRVAACKKAIINSLSGDATELRDTLLALFDELENAEESLLQTMELSALSRAKVEIVRYDHRLKFCTNSL